MPEDPSRFELPADLQQFEKQLAATAPSCGKLETDRLLFEAGRRSVVTSNDGWRATVATAVASSLVSVLATALVTALVVTSPPNEEQPPVRGVDLVVSSPDSAAEATSLVEQRRVWLQDDTEPSSGVGSQPGSLPAASGITEPSHRSLLRDLLDQQARYSPHQSLSGTNS